MLNNLTGLRFYAALWVFLYHSMGYGVKELDSLFLHKGYAGVDMFFILSGFILTFVYYKSFFEEKITLLKYKQFIVKRFAKIYPMHIISFVIVAIMLCFTNHVFLRKEIELIPSILLLIHSWGITDVMVLGAPSWNTYSWTISSEWFAYLFVFAPFSFLFKFGKKIFVIIILLIVFFFLYKWSMTENFDLNSNEKLSHSGLERLFPEFILGMMLGYFRIINVRVSKVMSTLLFFLSLCVFAILMYGNTRLSFDALCIIPLAGIIFSLSYNTYVDYLFKNKVFIYLGNISFTFYIIQIITFYTLKKPIEWLNMQNLSTIPLVGIKVMGLMGLNLLLAAAFYEYYEEPVRKLIVKKFLKE